MLMPVHEVPQLQLVTLQVKRIHEYKRQFMNVLGIIHRYHTIKSLDPSERSQARTLHVALLCQ